ncbi:MAG: hypothetical protein NXI04_04990 [Planctomycetaceae bacterium]|nr:hypothetical protein [Planctomycetaceae bacterium]
MMRSPLQSVMCLCTMWLLAVNASTCHAQRSIWGLFYRNYFTVETTIDRTTTVTIDDGKPIVNKSREVLQVRYDVRRLRPTEVVLLATIQKCRRIPVTDGEAQTESQSARTQITAADERLTARLEKLEFEVHISPDGGINDIKVPAEFYRQLDAARLSSQSVLQSTLTKATISSWLARPFWMVTDVGRYESDNEWQQIDEVSMGLLGQIRTLVTCAVTDVEEQKASVAITGKSRHISPVNLSAENGQIAFTDLKVTASDFDGEAVMIRESDQIDERTERPAQRPWFESMTLRWNVEGETRARTQNGGRRIVFQQKRTESSRLLPDYYVGNLPLFRAPRELQVPQ